MSEKNHIEQPPRRRFRFSLRTLLVVTAVVCIGLGWKMNQLHRQRRAVEEILAQGGHVHYDYQFDANGDRMRDAKPPGPAWFRRLAGDDFFAQVVDVSSTDGNFDDTSPLADLPHLQSVILTTKRLDDVTFLAELQDLEELQLADMPISDLSPLDGLVNMDELTLARIPVRDLSPLANMRRLRSLVLIGREGQPSDLSPLANLTNLSHLVIRETRFDDLTPLANLRNLEFLYLENTQVSDEEIEELQQAMPNLRVYP